MSFFKSRLLSRNIASAIFDGPNLFPGLSNGRYDLTFTSGFQAVVTDPGVLVDNDQYYIAYKVASGPVGGAIRARAFGTAVPFVNVGDYFSDYQSADGTAIYWQNNGVTGDYRITRVSIRKVPVVAAAAAENAAPTIGGTPQSIVELGSSFDFTPTHNDPDGDSVTFEIQNQPPGWSWDSGTGQLTSPVLNTESTFADINIGVNDGHNATVWLGSFDVVAQSANPTPLISSVSGSVAQGSTVTVNASSNSFTANRDGQVAYVSAAGDAIGTESSALKALTGAGSVDWVADGTHGYSASGTKALKAYKAGDGNQGLDLTPHTIPLPAASDEIFISYAMRLNSADAIPEGGHLKGPRALGSGTGHADQPGIGYIVLRDDGDSYLEANGGPSSWTNFYVNDVSDAAIKSAFESGFVTQFHYSKLGANDVNNGKRFACLLLPDGTQSREHKGWLDHESHNGYYNQQDVDGYPFTDNGWAVAESCRTRKGGTTGDYERVTMWFWKRPTDEATVWMDAFFVNDSHECVMIANASTLESATKIVIQPMTSRSTSSIAIQVELANLGVDDKYLFLTATANTMQQATRFDRLQ